MTDPEVNDIDVLQEIEQESIFIIGKVISVEKRIVRIRVNKNKNSSHILFGGKTVKNVSVGSYVKIVKGFVSIIGKVEGENIVEEKYFNRQYNKEETRINRTLEVSLFGHFEGVNFKQGIKEMPLIDNECYLLNRKEFNALHRFVSESAKKVLIGRLTEEPSQEIFLSVNKLFASHIGIFGNTGSGKSNTLARIYSELFEVGLKTEHFKENARFFFIDFNGEYSDDACISEHKKVYNLSTDAVEENDARDKFPLSEKDLVSTELISLLADATDKTQKPFIARTISFYEKIHAAADPIDYFKNVLQRRVADVLRMSDKEKAYVLIDYLKLILPPSFDEHGYEADLTDDIEWHNNIHGYLMRANRTHYLQDNPAYVQETKLYQQVQGYVFPRDVISKVIHFLYLQLVFDVYTDKAQNEHIAPAINKLKSKKKDIEKVLDTTSADQDEFAEANLVVVNLDKVNLEMKKTLPLLFSKKIYSAQKKKRKVNAGQTPESLHIIIDEAHNILSKESVRETESWKDYRLEAFEEIIKEGRKFNVFLTIASQRPHDISPTIISQLHNYFIHRLINDNDINAVEKAVAYLDRLSFQTIPILSVGSCFVAGLASDIPVKVDITLLEERRRPKSGTIDLEEAWN